ncbi:nuclear transport factor 2 family protein [Altericroceibacterium xinjiangense]|uniref:nuclear transport factor 2 family protein n=1 Tax=Altericroceibacterium xinjiangense TaxID=762261 RepID=UPI000F7E819D|nr:nuclear transport factor 2 family protein [Altericroceibacterium xinjiangense]
MAFALTGCGNPGEGGTAPSMARIAAATPQERPTPSSRRAPVPEAAAPLAGEVDPDSPEAALQAYYRAIDAGDWDAAYQLWNRGGAASGQTLSEFREGFAATRSTTVAITGPVRTEGAAGSLYATVPVEVEAVQNDGTRQRFTGSYVLRRVNDVPGASVEQLRWHIYSAALKPA